MDPPESQFVPSPGLSDKSHNRAHARKVIALNKAFNIFPEAYRLDILSPLVLTIEAIDKIARCYSRLSLALVDDFHRARVKHKIARLDIIIAQAANQASALKAILCRIQNRKAKRLEQLEIIATIKNNNLQAEAIIAKE